jgi:hypothetical protein
LQSAALSDPALPAFPPIPYTSSGAAKSMADEQIYRVRPAPREL